MVTPSTSNTLLYKTTKEPCGLFTLNNDPVWPVRNQNEYRALERIVALFGGKLEECTDPCEEQRTGVECVVGLGSEVAEETRLYGHLTGRQTRIAENRQELHEIENLALIVTTEAILDYDLLAEIYDVRRDFRSAPGLIFSHDVALLRQQVLARSATLHFSIPANLQRIDIYPHLQFSELADTDTVMFGGKAETARFREAVRAGAGVLSLQTHSDGVDAFLKPDLILCPMGQPPADAPETRLPICKISNFCYRKFEPIEDLIEKGIFLAPEEIIARIFVLDVCWGLRPPERINDPAWGYTRRLLSAFSTGALLTPWELVSTQPRTLMALASDISAGISVGEAVAQHLDRSFQSGSNHRMCIIGDPRLALLPAQVDKNLNLTETVPETAHHVRTEAAATALSFLRSYILNVRNGRHAVYEDLSDKTLDALQACEASLYGGSAQVDSPESVEFRNCLLDFLVRRWPVAVSAWNSFISKSGAISDAGPCWICGNLTRRYEAELWTAGNPQRIVINCPNCGHIGDLPVGKEVSFTIKPGGVVQLVGPTENALAAVMIDSFINRTFERWPVEGNHLASKMKLAAPWPEGPLRFAVFVVWPDFQLAVLGAGARGELL